jgi:hypothetical protein
MPGDDLDISLAHPKERGDEPADGSVRLVVNRRCRRAHDEPAGPRSTDLVATSPRDDADPDIERGRVGVDQVSV